MAVRPAKATTTARDERAAPGERRSACRFALGTICWCLVSGCGPEAPEEFAETSRQALAGTVLYVAGPRSSRADAAIQDRLREAGLTVAVISARGATAADASGKSLVVISSTVPAAAVGSAFRDVSVPVMTWESGIYAAMGMTLRSLPSSGSRGGQRHALIVSTESPLAADLSGRVTLTRRESTFNWGMPNDAARVVALPGDPAKAIVFAYDADDPMPGLRAPSRRIGFFLGDAGATLLTREGWALFDAAIAWALEKPASARDTDGDRLSDTVESDTKLFVDAGDTGTDPNDPDTDGDGIADGDEVLGTSGGLDLPELGAHPLRKNVLLEYDWFDDELDCGPHSHRPSQAVIERVNQMFANAPVSNPDGSRGITLVQDFGQGGAFTGGNRIADSDGVLPGTFDAEYLSHRERHFSANRQGYFHYVMLPHHYNTNSPSSGFGEIVGDDLIVSLRCENSDWNVGNTIAHELGHNLGLHHGGPGDPTNYKPNYNSIMNYNYQFNGVDDDCTPPGDGVLDYSHGLANTLDENALNEPHGICGGVPWDFDGDGAIEDGAVAEDVNFDGLLRILPDYDDWSSLVYDWDPPFAAARMLSPQVVECDPVPPHAMP